MSSVPGVLKPIMTAKQYSNNTVRQCTYKRKTEAPSRNHYCRGKAIRIVYSECVSVVIVMENAMHMRRIILSFVACLVLPYFSTLSHKRHDFRKNVIECRICFLLFFATFVWNISHSKIIVRYYHKYKYAFT